MAKTPYAGNLRHSIILQTRSRTTDTGGGFTSAWANTRTLFAQIDPVDGSNDYSSGRREHNLTHDVYTRYYSDINFKSNGGQMRISWDDSGTTRILAIKYVLTIQERDRNLKFRCAEGGVNDS